ncbi:MAG: hypothetical protein WD077_07510 [Bacteroidia bacterium]
MKRLIYLFTVLLMVSSCKKDDPDPTDEDPTQAMRIEDDVTTNTTWENRVDNPDEPDYIIANNINVDAALVIAEGVRIEMESGVSVEVRSSGSLHAAGSATEPVVFTGVQATAGYWDVLEFNSNNPENLLSHCRIEYGGGSVTYKNSMVWLQNSNNAQVGIDNTTFTGSMGHGLYAESGTEFSAFSNNTFSANGAEGLAIFANHIGSLDETSDYDNENEASFILVGGSTFASTTTVPATNAAFLMDGNFDIEADVIVSPGTTFRMGSSASIEVHSDGSLNCVGTDGNMIRFLGEVETDSYWDVIEFDSNNPHNKFHYVEVAHGGGSSTYEYSSIWLQNSNNGQLELQNSLVRMSGGWGLYVEAGTTIIPGTIVDLLSSNTFENNGLNSSSDCTGGCDIFLP